jgi:ADP-ribose pyrophosphatase YjhB (NUDIX family)
MATPEFIRALRAQIGTALLQVPTVSVLTHDAEGRILLVQDKPSGLWGPPGGIVDPHELPSDAAVREVWEEAGVYVELTQILGVFAGARFSVVYPNGDRLSGVETVFAARVISGMPRADQEETSDAGFFDPGEIEQLACYPHFLEIYQAVSQGQPHPYFKPATWRLPQT